MDRCSASEGRSRGADLLVQDATGNSAPGWERLEQSHPAATNFVTLVLEDMHAVPPRRPADVLTCTWRGDQGICPVHGAETSVEQHASDKVVAPVYGRSCDESKLIRRMT